jgi:hypothetical protein
MNTLVSSDHQARRDAILSAVEAYVQTVASPTGRDWDVVEKRNHLIRVIDQHTADRCALCGATGHAAKDCKWGKST